MDIAVRTPHIQKSSIHNSEDDKSEFTIGSSTYRSVDKILQPLSIIGQNASTGSVCSTPSGRNRTKCQSPSGKRRPEKRTKQHVGVTDKIMYARIGGNEDIKPNKHDDNAMTIYSITGIDKGTNTDNINSNENPVESVVLSDDTSVAPSIVSQISFPDIAPPTNKFVIDATYAHFPELSVPSSPYARHDLETNDKFLKVLRNSPNPLVTIYNEYWQYIPSVFRARLLSTSASKYDNLTTADSLIELFTPIYKELEKLDVSLTLSNRGVEHCSKVTKNLIFIGENKRLSDNFKAAMSQLLT